MIQHPSLLNSFKLALSLLTRLPVPAINNEISAIDSGRSALFYPLVGLLIGLILYLPVLFFGHASAILLAALITVIWALLSGGLHLDGLADSADGWLGGGLDAADKDKTLKIMKDPRSGAAGVIAISSILLLKFAALTTILASPSHAASIILFAPAVGRNMILLLMLSSHNANPNSMAQLVDNNLPRQSALWMSLSVFAVAALFSLFGLIVALLVFWLLRRLMQQRLGGYTGDTLGATVEICETFFLIGYALF